MKSLFSSLLSQYSNRPLSKTRRYTWSLIKAMSFPTAVFTSMTNFGSLTFAAIVQTSNTRQPIQANNLFIFSPLKMLSNARIQPTEASAIATTYQKPRNLSMKGSLARVGWNELFGAAYIEG